MYSTLYAKRQQFPPYVPRSWYVEDAQSLPWVRSIEIKISDKLIKERSRGLVLAHNRQTHGGLSTFDYVIIIADGLSPEYERFVTIKELMHCYFPPTPEMAKFVTSTSIVLDNHFRAFFGASIVRSAQSIAEIMALWMAIGVTCTEHRRGELIDLKVEPSDIVTELKIPIVTAKALISPQFEDEIASLLR